jgi:hypothetical protein
MALILAWGGGVPLEIEKRRRPNDVMLNAIPRNTINAQCAVYVQITHCCHAFMPNYKGKKSEKDKRWYASKDGLFIIFGTGSDCGAVLGDNALLSRRGPERRF